MLILLLELKQEILEAFFYVYLLLCNFEHALHDRSNLKLVQEMQLFYQNLFTIFVSFIKIKILQDKIQESK